MALNGYLSATQNLIQPASSPIPLIPTSVLTGFVNEARNHIAAEGECVRAHGNLTLIANQETYNFSVITASATDAPALQSVISVRMLYLQTAVGPPATYNQMNLRSYEYFNSRYRVLGGSGTPVNVGQHKQGALGNLLFNPVPNTAFTILLDCVWLPSALTSDTTPEAIPPLWQDAVQFYAAWLGLMNLQRQADADKQFERYDMMMQRARSSSTSSELPGNMPGDIGSQMAAQKTPLFMVTGGQRAA